jgi:hypothetical protein
VYRSSAVEFQPLVFPHGPPHQDAIKHMEDPVERRFVVLAHSSLSILEGLDYRRGTTLPGFCHSTGEIASSSSLGVSLWPPYHLWPEGSQQDISR